MSTTAKSCPKCGAAPAKRTSKTTWIIGGFFALMFVGYISSKKNHDAAEAQKTPEEIAAAAKKERAFQKTVLMAKAIKGNLRDPSSVDWEVIRANDDASVICLQYRAKNGFGGYAREIAVLAQDRASADKKAWNKHCTGPLRDLAHARVAI